MGFSIGELGPSTQSVVFVKVRDDIARKLPVLEWIRIQGSEWEKDPAKTDVSERREVPREQSFSEHWQPLSVAEGPLDFGYSLPVIVTQWTPRPGVEQWVMGRMAGAI